MPRLTQCMIQHQTRMVTAFAIPTLTIAVRMY